MSANPDSVGMSEDQIISLLSHWLARHVDTGELRRRLDEIGTEGLGPVEAEAVDELRSELAQGAPRASLERVVRETVEALALGA
jgi:hypothetical protein